MYYEHSFDDPVDTDYFIKYFREKHRLCWKEIYLKFNAIMLHKAVKCKKCYQWVQLSQMATCAGDFHDVDFNESNIDPEIFEIMKR